MGKWARYNNGGTKAAGAALIAIALVMALLGFATSSSAQQVPEGEFPAKLRLRGSTGEEFVHVVYTVNGFIGRYIAIDTDWSEYEFSLPPEAQTVKVFFDNDGLTETGADKNLIVDWLEVNGVRIETESAGVLSKGVFNGVDCDEGYRQSEFLACNGFFEFDLAGVLPPVDPNPPGEGSLPIVVDAQGSAGSEIIGLEINGRVVQRWTMTTTTTSYRYNHPSELPIDRARIVFNNDAIDGNGKDRNVRVDSVRIDDTAYDPRDMETKGTWNGTDCGTGFRQSNWLHCNGWFNIPVGDEPEPGTAIVTVTAQGTTGTEIIDLSAQATGEVFATWNLDTTDRQFRIELPVVDAFDGLTVSFINDAFVPNLGDRNVRVSEITVGNDVYDPADLRSRGTWNGTDCGVGFRNSQWLHCNGWFSVPGG